MTVGSEVTFRSLQIPSVEWSSSQFYAEY